MSKLSYHRRIGSLPFADARRQRSGNRVTGHLLSEFLVSLGLLFLLLAANLGILSSSASWAREAAHSRNATSLARDAMEQVIAASTPEERPQAQSAFPLPGSRPHTVVLYHRTVELLPLGEGFEGLQLARVSVSWDEAEPSIVLERYVLDR